MDNYYASLLSPSETNEDNATTLSLSQEQEQSSIASNETTTIPPVSSTANRISILLSRKGADDSDKTSCTTLSSSVNNQTCRLAVVARIPRKRQDHDDPIMYTLRYFAFMDDRRRFTNLDSLLTRLAPLEVVHLSCTESCQMDEKSSTNTKNHQKHRRSREVLELLERIQALLQTRTDILSTNQLENESQQNDKNAPADDLVHLMTTLPKELSNPSSAASHVDSILTRLLGGDSSKQTLLYRGDKKLVEDSLIKRAIGLFLHGEGLNMTTIHSDDSTSSYFGRYELLEGNLSSHLILDRTASECINLLPPRHAGKSSVEVGGSRSNNSLLGILDHCKTRMGSRLLEMWLRQPLVRLKDILYRQNAVRYLVEEEPLGRDRLRDEGLSSLRGFDLDALYSRLGATMNMDGEIMGGTTKALEMLYKLWLFADQMLPILIDCLRGLLKEQSNEQDGNTNVLNMDDDNTNNAIHKSFHGLQHVWNELQRSVQLVEAVLDFEAAPREFLVKTTFDEHLADIRQELNSINLELDKLHSDMNEIWAEVSGESIGQVRLESTDKSSSSISNNETSEACAWQFRLLDTNHSKVLQDRLGSTVTVHRLLKNGVYFSTKELRQLGTKKHDLLAEYDKHQRGIVKNAMSVAITYIPVLERASEIIAEVDVLASLAHAAAFNPHGYCRPEMTDGEEDGLGIELTDARHPCVELQDTVEFIPNDFSMIFGQSSFLLVTGPNMGGKSTYIRSLGAIITMAQIGSYVPCKHAKINIVHHILARVGAGDSQDRGISTFMAEMLEASSILRTATKRSLIIIDELGRGTSTFDGFGLAKAISEYIVQQIGCITVFASHFHELTALEDQEDSVKNVHVTARAADDTRGLTFLYEVKPGPCLESFGIQVAEMASVPSSVIADAKRRAKQLENFDSKKRLKSGHGDVDEDGRQSLAPSEKISEARDFIQKFRKIPLVSLKTVEEKREAFQNILQ